MTRRRQNISAGLLATIVATAIGVGGFWTGRIAQARSEGGSEAAIAAKVERHDRDIDRVEKRVDTLESRLIADLRAINESVQAGNAKLARIEGKIEGK